LSMRRPVRRPWHGGGDTASDAQGSGEKAQDTPENFGERATARKDLQESCGVPAWGFSGLPTVALAKGGGRLWLFWRSVPLGSAWMGRRARMPEAVVVGARSVGFWAPHESRAEHESARPFVIRPGSVWSLARTVDRHVGP
jgi:hypothetical protein